MEQRPSLSNQLQFFLNSLRYASRHKKHVDAVHEISPQIEAQCKIKFPRILEEIRLDSSDSTGFLISMISKVVEGMIDRPEKMMLWKLYFLDGVMDKDVALRIGKTTKTVTRWGQAFADEIVLELIKRNNQLITTSTEISIKDEDKVALYLHQTYNNLSFQEGKILYFYFRGKSAQYVCSKMHFAYDTYRKHVTKINRELGVNHMNLTIPIVAKIIIEALK